MHKKVENAIAPTFRHNLIYNQNKLLSGEEGK